MNAILKLLCLAPLFVGFVRAGQFGGPGGGLPMGLAPASPEVNIQWFATLEGAKKEAVRANRPILVISGTPHCSGISGIW